MYKSIACIALLCLTAVSAGVIETQHVVEEPVFAKVGTAVHSAPSAVSHKSITRFHNKAVVSPVVAPVVKTTTVHEAPLVSVVRTAPVVQAYAAAPAVHSVPVVHADPIVHAVSDVSFARTAPITHSHSIPFVHAAHAAYTIHH